MDFTRLKNKILIFFAVVLIILTLSFFQREVKSFFYFISSPIQKVFWQIGDGMSDFFETILSFDSLKKNNEELLFKNQELLGEVSQLKELKKENQILREAFDVARQNDFKLEIAEIISKDPFQDSILINKGKNLGLSKGMPVLTEDKVLLGKIFEVYDNFSKVLLISDKLSSFDAKIPEKEIYGVVKGEGNSSMIFDLIPQEKEVKEEDLVITSSLGGIFPKGLLVGKIKEIRKSDVKPYQKATLGPFFNLSGLELIFIITNF